MIESMKRESSAMAGRIAPRARVRMRRRYLRAFAILLLLLAAAGTRADTIIRNVNVLPMTGAGVLMKYEVRVEGDRIVEVRPAGTGEAAG